MAVFQCPVKNLFARKNWSVFWFLLQGRIILAPLFYVNFADFWLADQLNSLVVVFVDFQYFICFYLTNDNWMTANGKKLDLIILLHCVTYIYNWCIMFCVQLFDRHKCLCWLYSNNTSIGWLSAGMVEICTVFATLQRHKGSFSSSCECWEICHFFPCYAVQHNEYDVYRLVSIASIKIFPFDHFPEELEWTRSTSLSSIKLKLQFKGYSYFCLYWKWPLNLILLII